MTTEKKQQQQKQRFHDFAWYVAGLFHTPAAKEGSTALKEAVQAFNSRLSDMLAALPFDFGGTPRVLPKGIATSVSADFCLEKVVTEEQMARLAFLANYTGFSSAVKVQALCPRPETVSALPVLQVERNLKVLRALLHDDFHSATAFWNKYDDYLQLLDDGMALNGNNCMTRIFDGFWECACTQSNRWPVVDGIRRMDWVLHAGKHFAKWWLWQLLQKRLAGSLREGARDGKEEKEGEEEAEAQKMSEAQETRRKELVIGFWGSGSLLYELELLFVAVYSCCFHESGFSSKEQPSPQKRSTLPSLTVVCIDERYFPRNKVHSITNTVVVVLNMYDRSSQELMPLLRRASSYCGLLSKELGMNIDLVWSRPDLIRRRRVVRIPTDEEVPLPASLDIAIAVDIDDAPTSVDIVRILRDRVLVPAKQWNPAVEILALNGTKWDNQVPTPPGVTYLFGPVHLAYFDAAWTPRDNKPTRLW